MVRVRPVEEPSGKRNQKQNRAGRGEGVMSPGERRKGSGGDLD
tara:strand:- start:343 stop:471 length:129 start_codon:yes stop_codon:yes gene_type:complete